MKNVITATWRASTGVRDFMYGAGEAGWLLGHNARKALGFLGHVSKEAITFLIKEAPVAYRKAKPFLVDAKEEALYIGVNLVGLVAILALLLAKGFLLAMGLKGYLAKKALGLKGCLAKGVSIAIGFAKGLRDSLVAGWNFRNELIAEWA